MTKLSLSQELITQTIWKSHPVDHLNFEGVTFLKR